MKLSEALYELAGSIQPFQVHKPHALRVQAVGADSIDDLVFLRLEVTDLIAGDRQMLDLVLPLKVAAEMIGGMVVQMIPPDGPPRAVTDGFEFPDVG